MGLIQRIAGRLGYIHREQAVLSATKTVLLRAALLSAEHKIAELTAENNRLITESSKPLWIVGRYKGGRGDKVVWDLEGVFTTRRAAVDACKTEFFFIASVGKNMSFPVGTDEFPDCEYPLLERVV